MQSFKIYILIFHFVSVILSRLKAGSIRDIFHYAALYCQLKPLHL